MLQQSKMTYYQQLDSELLHDGEELWKTVKPFFPMHAVFIRNLVQALLLYLPYFTTFFTHFKSVIVL